ncbi:hypothetical protein Tco_0104586 [Tanacetum coccineum]
MCGNREKLTPINIKHHIHNNEFSRGYPTWVYHSEPRIIALPVVDDTNDMINVLNDIRRENNCIEPEPNTHTEHNTNTTSTSNEPPEAAGLAKDDMEGLFEMGNEELFPGGLSAFGTWDAELQWECVLKLSTLMLNYDINFIQCIGEVFVQCREPKIGYGLKVLIEYQPTAERKDVCVIVPKWIQEQDSHSAKSSSSVSFTTAPKMVINSPCLNGKKELAIPEPPVSIPQGQRTSEVFQALNSKLNRSLVNEPPLLLNFEDKLFAREPDIKKVH